jgi:hypothetical protein
MIKLWLLLLLYPPALKIIITITSTTKLLMTLINLQIHIVTSLFSSSPPSSSYPAPAPSPLLKTCHFQTTWAPLPLIQYIPVTTTPPPTDKVKMYSVPRTFRHGRLITQIRVASLHACRIPGDSAFPPSDYKIITPVTGLPTKPLDWKRIHFLTGNFLNKGNMLR